jgi:hypothetical protein
MAERKAHREARLKAAACGVSPLCLECEWRKPDGSVKRGVPSSWLTLGPGREVPCKSSKLLGRKVPLKGGGEGEIVGCATPLGESLLQTGTRSRRYKCQGALLLKTPLGVIVPVPASVARERMRVREGNCPDAVTYARGMVATMEREALRAGHSLVMGQDLPYPHRKGSSVCCVNASKYHGALDDLYVAAMEGSVPDLDVVRAVRAALPKHLRVAVRVETLDDVPAAIDAIREHCAEAWRQKEAASKESRRDYQKKITAAKRALKLKGWGTNADGQVVAAKRGLPKGGGRASKASSASSSAVRLDAFDGSGLDDLDAPIASDALEASW